MRGGAAYALTVGFRATRRAQGADDEAVEPHKGRDVLEADLGMVDRLRFRNPEMRGYSPERERLGDGEVLVPVPRGEFHGRLHPTVSGERREPLHLRAYVGRQRLVEFVEALRFRVGE